VTNIPKLHRLLLQAFDKYQENVFTLHYGKFSIKAFTQTTLLDVVFWQCLCCNSPAGLYSVALNDIFHPSVEGGWMANFQSLANTKKIHIIIIEIPYMIL